MAPRSRVESEDEERPLADASCATLGRRSRSSSRRGRPAGVDVALGRARLAAGGFANDDAGVRARAVVCAREGSRAEQRRWGVKEPLVGPNTIFIKSRLGFSHLLTKFKYWSSTEFRASV